MQRRSFLIGGLSATASLAAHSSARSQETFPSRPVRIIVPYPAGGGPDVLARGLGPRLGQVLGKPVIFENKVGAAGVLAAQYAAQQAPDGYTLLLGANTHLVQKIMQPSLKFDPLGDFTAVSAMASSPTIMTVRADGPYQRLEDVIAAARANRGKMNYSSGGIGSAAHLAGATLVSLAGLEATHIPMKGSVEILASLLRGDADFAFPIASTGLPQVQGGRLRALAVTSAERLKELPEVPTLRERLNSELAVQDSWFGFWAPVATPRPIVARLHEAISRVVAEPEVKAKFEAAGSIAVVAASPEAFDGFVKSEYRKWADIVKLTGVTTG
jgi:tripartite-type tricarboxylate transporter receptor subunit TctC